MSTLILTKPLRRISSSMPILSLKWLSAVEIRASYGQGKNQSIVVQFTNVGNVLSLLLKSSPTGDMQITMCKLFLHNWTKYWYFSLNEPIGFIEAISSTIFAFSSVGNKFGIYPLLRMLQTSSTIDSLRIWVSLNKKMVCLCSRPAIFMIFWTS